MKSNEIAKSRLDELSWRDIPGAKTAAKVASGIKGMADPNGSFTGGYQTQASKQSLYAYAERAFQPWNQYVTNLQQRGIPDPELPKYMTAWATKYFGVQMPPYPGMLNDKTTMDYLQKGVAMQFTKDAPDPAQQPQQAQPTTQPSASGAATGGAAGATAPAAQTQQPQANPAHAIFQDPAKFTAEFNKYIQGTGLQQLVNFKLKDVLKNMWMRSGGTRVESKNNKGKRV